MLTHMFVIEHVFSGFNRMVQCWQFSIKSFDV